MQIAPAHVHVIRADSYRRVRWKNGLGWTREIARFPDADEAWNWRLSIAEIEQDASFSAFPAVDRELVLLTGNGLRLRFSEGGAHELLPPHDSHRFAGEVSVAGELIDGPTTDFNLMWRRDACDARLWHRPLVGALALFVDPGDTWAVYLMAGQARFSDDSGGSELYAGDTALLTAPQMRARSIIDGGGEALVMQLLPKASTPVA